jgi:hypothetical protein
MSDYELYRGRNRLGRLTAKLIVKCWSDGLLAPDDYVSQVGGKGFTDIETAIHAIKAHAVSINDNPSNTDDILLNHEGRKIGPYSVSDCLALIGCGLISKKGRFLRKGTQNWESLETLSTASEQQIKKESLPYSIWKEIKGCLSGFAAIAAPLAIAIAAISRCQKSDNSTADNQAGYASKSSQETPGKNLQEALPGYDGFLYIAEGEYEPLPIREIFPSVAIAAANIVLPPRQVKGDSAPVFPRENRVCETPIRVVNVKKGDTFRVEISPDRFLKKTEELIEITEDSAFAILEPQTIFDFPALEKLNQTSSFNITITIQKNKEATHSKTYTWQAHQINDCPLAFKSLTPLRNGKIAYHTEALPFTIAGYVNENHPWIDGLLREAKNNSGGISFSGYQQGREHTLAQIDAIWKTLKNRGISYSSIGTSTSSRYYSFQHVRLLDQTIESTQANCLDGSILMASILRKIGLQTAIVVTPTHAYLLVNQFKDNPFAWIGIETTMLQTSSLDEAIKVGTHNGKECLYQIKKKNGTSEDGLPFSGNESQIVYVDAMRSLNIQPIPFSK